MKKLDLSYIAGLIDGEGTLSVGIRKPNVKSREQNFQLCLNFQIGMCDEEIVKWLKDTTQMGSIYNYKRKNSLHRDIWYWSVNIRDAKLLLPLLLPFLKVKKQQAVLYLELLTLRENNTKTGDRTRQFEIYEKMKILNKRGTN